MQTIITTLLACFSNRGLLASVSPGRGTEISWEVCKTAKFSEKFSELQSIAQKFSFVILSETSFLVRSKLWPIIFWGTFWKQFIFDAFTALSFDVESTLWNVGGDFPNLNHFYNVFFCQMAWFGIVSYMAFYTLCECGIVCCGVGMARLSPTSPPSDHF